MRALYLNATEAEERKGCCIETMTGVWHAHCVPCQGAGLRRATRSASRRNLYQFNMRRRFRNGLAMQPHALDVEFDRFADELPGFFERCPGSNTPWKVGNMRAVPRCSFSKNTVYLFISAPPASV